MPNIKQIHDFAIKWCDKFRNQNINCIELLDHYMADDCNALGFQMDCGHSFSEKYGDAACHHEALDKIIDEIDDIPLLGSAIYSRWRYFNHWSYSCEEILAFENRSWFILALSRLAILTGENPFIFQGKPQKLHIVSNNICYGSQPKPDDEVEQHLTINTKGQVWFSAFNYGEGAGQYQEARTNNFKVEKATAEKILCTVAAYFSNEYDEVFATDIGDWTMEITNTDGVTYKFRGSLCADFNVDGTDLSDLMRDTLGMDDLYALDGNANPDQIDRITVDYQRITKIKPMEISDEATWDYVTWDYSECLIIDRETNTLEHIQNIGTKCKVSHKYEVEGGIESLLENFDAEELFANIACNPDDVIETPNETQNYTITVDYKKKPHHIITGSFDKNGLPEDFAEFAETVFRFMRFYGLGEILDPSVFGKVKHHKSDYIYCSVAFDEGYKTYYYITDDDSIEVGDYVVVPAGADNHHAVVEVIEIEYFSQEDVPLPVEKTKHIIRKCSEDNLMSADEYAK